MGKGQFLGEFEQVVLLAVARLDGEGYGVSIRREIETRTERPVTIGAIYATLDRLAAKGYLAVTPGAPTPERGGRAKRFYDVEPEGVAALRSSWGMLDRMWEDVAFKPGTAP